MVLKRLLLVFIVLFILATPLTAEQSEPIKAQGSYWFKKWSSNSVENHVYGRAIAQLSDGGFVVLGRHSLQDRIWIGRTDSDGSLIWQKFISASKITYPGAVIQASNGDIIVTGTRGAQGWIIRLSLAGEILWQKSFDSYGNSSDEIRDLVETSDQGFMIVATIRTENDSSAKRFWVAKLDENGNFMWQNMYADIHGRVNSVARSANNKYIVAGDIYLNSFNYGRLVLLDESGDEVWQKSYGDGVLNYRLIEVIPTSDNGYIALGYVESTVWVWVLKINEDGVVQWQKLLPKPDSYSIAQGIEQTSDGGYLVLAGLTAIQ